MCRNVPTILFYRNGELVTQLVSIGMLGGRGTTTEVLEWILANVGAVTTEQEEDPRDRASHGSKVVTRY